MGASVGAWVGASVGTVVGAGVGTAVAGGGTCVGGNSVSVMVGTAVTTGGRLAVIVMTTIGCVWAMGTGIVGCRVAGSVVVGLTGAGSVQLARANRQMNESRAGRYFIGDLSGKMGSSKFQILTKDHQYKIMKGDWLKL